LWRGYFLIPTFAILFDLLAKHRYSSNGPRLLRWSALVYGLGSVLLAVLYLSMAGPAMGRSGGDE
jgi:hypothetical protein